jgi:protoporphyrinogen oxidase
VAYVSTQRILDAAKRRFGQSEKNARFKSDFMDAVTSAVTDPYVIAFRGVSVPANLEQDIEADSSNYAVALVGVLRFLSKLGWPNQEQDIDFERWYQDEVGRANARYYVDNEVEGVFGSDPATLDD